MPEEALSLIISVLEVCRQLPVIYVMKLIGYLGWLLVGSMIIVSMFVGIIRDN